MAPCSQRSGMAVITSASSRSSALPRDPCSHNHGELLVGVIDDHVVAMGALQRKGEAVAALRRMRVHPSRQRRGYGR